MMRRQSRKISLPQPLDFRKSIESLAARVELGIKVAGIRPMLFVSFSTRLATA